MTERKVYGLIILIAFLLVLSSTSEIIPFITQEQSKIILLISLGVFVVVFAKMFFE